MVFFQVIAALIVVILVVQHSPLGKPLEEMLKKQASTKDKAEPVIVEVAPATAPTPQPVAIQAQALEVEQVKVANVSAAAHEVAINAPWSRFDVPTYMRRGIDITKKPRKTRKKVPTATQSQDAPGFEVMA